MNKRELALKKRRELLDIGAKLAIPYRSRMSKDVLIKAIQKAQKAKARKSVKKVKAVKKPVKAARKPKRPSTKKAPRTRTSITSPAPKPTKTEPMAPLFLDRGQPIPQTYNQDKLVALVRDPHWIYVYWELSGPKAKDMLKQFGAERLRSANWILKIRNLRNNATSEIAILLESYNWYINVPDDAEIMIEMGCYLDGSRHYLPVLKASNVLTPRARPSDKIDDHWVIMEEQFMKLLAYHQLGEYAKPSSPGQAAMNSGTLAQKNK